MGLALSALPANLHPIPASQRLPEHCNQRAVATVFLQEIQNIFGGQRAITPGEGVSAAANQAQIATAVTDADCTDAADLAGIYFAVLASYEQQIVNANASALATAVKQFRAAYAAELRKLPDLLKTASAQPFGGSPAGKPSSAGG